MLLVGQLTWLVWQPVIEDPITNVSPEIVCDINTHCLVLLTQGETRWRVQVTVLNCYSIILLWRVHLKYIHSDACATCLCLCSNYYHIYYHPRYPPFIKGSIWLHENIVWLFPYTYLPGRWLSWVSEINTVNLTRGICECNCMHSFGPAAALMRGYAMMPVWHIRNVVCHLIHVYIEAFNSLKLGFMATVKSKLAVKAQYTPLWNHQTFVKNMLSRAILWYMSSLG